jgi:hypothetical protein
VPSEFSLKPQLSQIWSLAKTGFLQLGQILCINQPDIEDNQSDASRINLSQLAPRLPCRIMITSLTPITQLFEKSTPMGYAMRPHGSKPNSATIIPIALSQT